MLALYRDEGANEGIYVTAESTFKKIAEEYNPMISSHDLEEVMKKLRRSSRSGISASALSMRTRLPLRSDPSSTR